MRHHFRLPPRHIRKRLVGDAAFLWLGVRTFELLFPGESAPTPLLPTPRTSLVIVIAAVLLCAVQVRIFREASLLRNLGVSLEAQLGFSLALVVTLELTARVLLTLLLSSAGPG
jgi:hypothetical protein